MYVITSKFENMELSMVLKKTIITIIKSLFTVATNNKMLKKFYYQAKLFEKLTLIT